MFPKKYIYLSLLSILFAMVFMVGGNAYAASVSSYIDTPVYYYPDINGGISTFGWTAIEGIPEEGHDYVTISNDLGPGTNTTSPSFNTPNIAGFPINSYGYGSGTTSPRGLNSVVVRDPNSIGRFGENGLIHIFTAQNGQEWFLAVDSNIDESIERSLYVFSVDQFGNLIQQFSYSMTDLGFNATDAFADWKEMNYLFYEPNLGYHIIAVPMTNGENTAGSFIGTQLIGINENGQELYSTQFKRLPLVDGYMVEYLFTDTLGHHRVGTTDGYMAFEYASGSSIVGLEEVSGSFMNLYNEFGLSSNSEIFGSPVRYLFDTNEGNKMCALTASHVPIPGGSDAKVYLFEIDPDGNYIPSSLKTIDSTTPGFPERRSDFGSYSGIENVYDDENGNHYLAIGYNRSNGSQATGKSYSFAVNDNGDILNDSIALYDHGMNQKPMAFGHDGSGAYWIGAMEHGPVASEFVAWTLTTGYTDYCGDGTINPDGVDGVSGTVDDERCDDGNVTNGDGCSSTCQIESTVSVNIDCTEGSSVNFYDYEGDSANYADNSAVTRRICPESATSTLSVDFSTFLVENHSTCASDSLTLYHGVDNTGSLIGSYCGTNSPGVVNGSAPGTCIYAEFSSDSSVNYAGWEATITCPAGGTGGGGDNGACPAYAAADSQPGTNVTTYEQQPATNTENGCVGGVFKDVHDTQRRRIWDCTGVNGGIDRRCSVLKNYCGDGVCSENPDFHENCDLCPEDCGMCDAPKCIEHIGNFATHPVTDLASGCAGGANKIFDINTNNTPSLWTRSCMNKKMSSVTAVTCRAGRAGSCGNGVVDGTEQCDDGDKNNNNDCTNSCTKAICGDGVIWNSGSGNEECDRENGCSTDCQRVAPSCDIATSTTNILVGGSVNFGLSYTQQLVGLSMFMCGGTSICGDGVIDYDGVDNILGNADDEMCDAGENNSDQSYGCSTSCKIIQPNPGVFGNVPNTCMNGVQDAGETGVDCGGSCQVCI